MKYFLSLLLMISSLVSTPGSPGRRGPFLETALIFPLEHWHNHSSMIVETASGDLLVSWFHGSGERQADDVKIEGARKRSGGKSWGSRFTMADTPGYPDTNCTLFIDQKERLWLFWPTILANEWHTAIMKYRVSSSYNKEGAPLWSRSEVLHLSPGQEFVEEVQRVTKEWESDLPSLSSDQQIRLTQQIASIRRQAEGKLTRRLGWMTRAHPQVINGRRMILPLYSDGYSFSLMAVSDDDGQTWRTSRPLVGRGNIQPSVVRKGDGSLYALMRDNGPAPKRLHQSSSFDLGETWSPVTDSSIPNPGSGAEIIGLLNGHWILIFNDTEIGRHRLAVSISEDEGKTWKWKRYLEHDEVGGAGGSYHYPSIIEGRDGTLHATYSFHLPAKQSKRDNNGNPLNKSIKYAHFNEDWIRQGEEYNTK